MIDPKQLRERVVRPVLQDLRMHSAAAEELLLGTAAQESRLCYLAQLGGGPALGIYQIEPATHRDLYENWLHYRTDILQDAFRMAGLWRTQPLRPGRGGTTTMPADSVLIGNLFYATAVARLLYRRVNETLPAATDLRGLAAYWKQHYNTPQGKGTVEEFARNYRDIINGDAT